MLSILGYDRPGLSDADLAALISPFCLDFANRNDGERHEILEAAGAWPGLVVAADLQPELHNSPVATIALRPAAIPHDSGEYVSMSKRLEPRYRLSRWTTLAEASYLIAVVFRLPEERGRWYFGGIASDELADPVKIQARLRIQTGLR